VLPWGLHTAGPGYLGYIPGGGLPDAGLADLITAVTNRYVGLWVGAPALVELESQVIRWFCELMGLPEGAGGLLTTGGSLANLGAVVTARQLRLPPDFLRGRLYHSRLTHHSMAKAARIAGFPDSALVELPCDMSGALDLGALRAAIAADRAAGLLPFFVTGNAGSTALGSIDDLAGLAQLCEEEGLWMHVDAAYGGFFALTERGRAALAGVERADSITLDPHKGLFLPYGTGCLLVRRRDDLVRAHRIGASYLPPAREDEHWDFADMGPELSREARGLRIWWPLQLHGAAAFRAALDEKMDLARGLSDRIAAHPELELSASPRLSLLAFRRRGADEAGQRALLSRVNQRRRSLITGVELEGRYHLRVCVLCFRTHQPHLDALWEDLMAALAEG
jgi:aromatic-L-amino-acid decarboxylase